nr:copia protein [Tanacetum cinerariifolium]
CPDLSLDHRFGMFKAYDGVGQFCDKGLEVAFRKSTCFVLNEDGVDFLTRDRSSNLYTIALNEVASNSSTCLLAKASFSQSWLWHQRLSHLNFATINNLVKNNLVQGIPKIKFEKDHLCSACEQGKIHQKHHKSKMAFASNKPLYLLHMDLCGPIRVQSINGKRYVELIMIMKSSTTNVETSINEEVFHESIPINMVPNDDEASTSHNEFNERFEDAYFDANTSFHDPSNVHNYYQPYLHEKKWTKDHPLHKIIDQAWMESSSDSDHEINANMVFMAQIEKVFSDSEASSSSADEKISEDLQYKYDVLKNQATTFEMNNKELNEQLKELIEKNNDLLAQTKVLKEQLQVKHVVIDTHAECQEKYEKLKAERYVYMIRYFAYFDIDKQHRKQIADQEVLYDKMSFQLVELDKHVRDLKNTVLEKDFKILELEECVRNKDLEIEKCLEHLNVCEKKLLKIGQTNQTIHMIMPSKDNLYNGRKGIGFENLSYFEKAKDLRATLYDKKVIGLGYTSMFLTHFDEALEIEKFKRS